MKKSVLAIAIALGAFTVKADVITNYVYVVSNIFNNVYTENVITQKIKNTHYNYYFTNYVSVVTNVFQTTFKTNIEVNVIFDNFDPFVNAASNAAANASSFANNAAAKATAAASAASSASSAASRAAASASSAAAAASDGLNRINQRIQWFDDHSGETITQNNYYFTTNLYFAEDSVARSGVAENAGAILSLEGRVGNNIETLQDQLATANGRIDTNAGAISSLEGRVGNNIEALQGQLATANGRIDTNAGAISSIEGRVGSIEACFNADFTTYSTQVVYRCDSIPEWSFRLDSSVYTTSGSSISLTLLDQNRPSSVGRDEILGFIWFPRNYNYGVQISYYVNGSANYVTLPDFYSFPDVFTVEKYTFRKHTEKFVPSSPAASNVVVRAVSLFGDSWSPKKSEGEMLSDVIDERTADLNRRVEALESEDPGLPEAIGMYARHRPSVTYSYYYTYGGNKLLYRVKVFTDKVTVVSSDDSSTTYGYDFEVLYADSSIGNMAEVSYVRKIIYPNDPASNELVTRLYRSGWSMYKLRGFTDDIHDLKGGASVGDRLVCYSNSLGYFVMQLDAVDLNQDKELQYYVSADFNVYDVNGSKIGRIMRDTDWASLSNWVEQVFQKK
jgi:hypothetical protein